jgi:hypothetical protein
MSILYNAVAYWHRLGPARKKPHPVKTLFIPTAGWVYREGVCPTIRLAPLGKAIIEMPDYPDYNVTGK